MFRRNLRRAFSSKRNLNSYYKVTGIYFLAAGTLVAGYKAWDYSRDPPAQRKHRTELLTQKMNQKPEFRGVKRSQSQEVIEKAKETLVVVFGQEKSGKSTFLDQIENEVGSRPVVRINCKETVEETMNSFNFEKKLSKL